MPLQRMCPAGAGMCHSVCRAYGEWSARERALKARAHGVQEIRYGVTAILQRKLPWRVLKRKELKK